MNHRVSSIRNLRTVKALRGESLTIDLGKSYQGTMTAWMKKNPNDPTYRSFDITNNRYLVLSKTKASDYYNEYGELVEAIEGKWKFDVELIPVGGIPDDVKTIYTGTILFINDITNSVGVELTDVRINLDDFDLEVFDSMEEAVANLGIGKMFKYSEENFDGVPSPNNSLIGITNI